MYTKSVFGSTETASRFSSSGAVVGNCRRAIEIQYIHRVLRMFIEPLVINILALSHNIPPNLHQRYIRSTAWASFRIPVEKELYP
jgi:hypothetical protein